MAKKKDDVKPDPSPGDDNPVDDNPTEGGDPPVDDPQPTDTPTDDVDDRGVSWENRAKEYERKLGEAQTQNTKLFDAFHEQLEAAPAAPQAAPQSGAYAKLDEYGFDRGLVDSILELAKENTQAELDKLTKDRIDPYVANSVESNNRRDIRLIISQDPGMSTYEDEMMQVLRESPEQRMHPDAPSRAAEIVKGRHFDDLVKAAKTEAREEAEKNRRIDSESVSGASITVGDETHTITEQEKRLVDYLKKQNVKVGDKEIDYADYVESREAYKARKEAKHEIPE